jgi:hypothetical protein
MQHEKIFDLILLLCNLQKGLFNVFRSTFPEVADLHELSDAPKKGFVKLYGFEWAFFTHGVGILFKRQQDGLIVDMHEFFNNPRLFDSWRLMQFLGGFGFKFRQSEVDEIIGWLVQEKRIETVDQAPHHYRITH